jgi:hypothetical protein
MVLGERTVLSDALFDAPDRLVSHGLPLHI